MSDGFDACVCDWDRGMAMRRLVSLLRSIQGECTDSECFTPTTGSSEVSVGHCDMLMLTVLGVAVAFLLYMTRPASLRGPSLSSAADTKPFSQNNGFDRDNQPPPPPPSMH